MVKLEVWQISQRSLSHRLWKKSWWMYREIIPFYPNYSGCCEWFFHLPRWISIPETFPAIKLHLGWIFHDFSMDLPLAPPTIWWKLANWNIHHFLKPGYQMVIIHPWWFIDGLWVITITFTITISKLKTVNQRFLWAMASSSQTLASHYHFGWIPMKMIIKLSQHN